MLALAEQQDNLKGLLQRLSHLYWSPLSLLLNIIIMEQGWCRKTFQ